MFFDAVAGLRRGRKDSQGRAKTCRHGEDFSHIDLP